MSKKNVHWLYGQLPVLVEKGAIRQSEVDFKGDYQRISPVISQVLAGTRFSEKDIVDCLRKQAPAFQKNDASEFARWLVGS